MNGLNELRSISDVVLSEIVLISVEENKLCGIFLFDLRITQETGAGVLLDIPFVKFISNVFFKI